MDAFDVATLLLRIALVALLYLFLFSVMRMAARGLDASSTRRGSATGRAGALRLVVMEPGASELSAGQTIQVRDGATLGRAARAMVVIADPTVSSEHARINRVGRAWVVADLGSTNGTRVNQTSVDGETPLAQGDELALGNVRFQVVAR